jgi:hypothetical protein
MRPSSVNGVRRNVPGIDATLHLLTQIGEKRIGVEAHELVHGDREDALLTARGGATDSSL